MSDDPPSIGVHDGAICSKCGAFGTMPHVWVEGMCILPHRNHSRATVGFCCEWCTDRLRITETAVYSDEKVARRTVERDISRRRAFRAVAEWQAASDRNRTLVSVVTGSTGQLPTMTYTAVPAGH